MRKQRGSVWVTLIIYLAIAGAVAAAIYSVYSFIDNRWQTSAGITEGKVQGRAELQPKLDSCNSDLDDANNKIALQNEGVQKAKDAASAALSKARAGVAQATRETLGAKAEAQRLSGLIAGAASSPRSSCPAGDAARELRKGG